MILAAAVTPQVVAAFAVTLFGDLGAAGADDVTFSGSVSERGEAPKNVWTPSPRERVP